ncbi:hypothetical protein BMS3Bbin11_00687 [bacterium BMS3Bbin11]|nr:hypothetical protein BMS3Abin11_01226 [bacterium BMS3Abin11]GBE45598.1 hypothetical protein BMS3Bbin11_00687 [bacterium BMS3Bbin11]GMT41450.1 MAG: hypothetical protein IEMM0001_2185 [bacterium]HDH08673.1 hypothetical protein [Gammaproteobacteria bacterium]HDH15163.1 hypothetical protein [Gammaproteobacteria bacterium]
MKLDTEKWFTEVYPDDGCALSLELSEKLHEEQTDWQMLDLMIQRPCFFLNVPTLPAGGVPVRHLRLTGRQITGRSTLRQNIIIMLFIRQPMPCRNLC